MHRIKLLLFSTVAIAIVALFAVTEVMAELTEPCGSVSGDTTADYACSDGMQNNYTVRIVKPFPQIAPCPDNPSEKCSTYGWNVSPELLSHFNLIVERSFEEKIVDSNATKTSSEKWLDCSGAGDPSQGADRFGQFLTWHCRMRFDCKDPVSGEYVNPFVTLRGELTTSAPTDWQVKQAADFAQGDYAITRGPTPECVDQSLKVSSSASEECRILGYAYDETNKVWIPISFLSKKEVDGCTVLSYNIWFFSNDPECKSDRYCTVGEPGCKLLKSVSGVQDPKQDYCMSPDNPECNECWKQEVGSPTTHSPQEFWYFNNGQESYSCYDLAVGYPYLCPQACYDNAKCP